MRFSAALFAVCSTVVLMGCGLEADRGDEGNAQRFLGRQSVCTILGDVQVGKPRAYFAPFDPVEDQALCALDSAKREVLAAHYNIRSERVLNKLIELHKRGVKVRVVVDAANAANSWNEGDDLLEKSGIQVVRFKPTAANAIMHLKTSVIDGTFAMSGSFNWNETAAAANDENMIAFRDPEIVSRYRNQVLELLGDKPRSVEAPRATPWAELHFAPETAVDRVIVKAIDGATTSVDVAMFTFTMSSISDALVRAHQRGVKVRLVTEKKQENLSTADDRVAAAGAFVLKAANRIGPHSAMHQKYAVIDNKRVITGATNWTFSGTRNNEEDLLLLDLPALAADYAKNFADILHVYGRIDGGQTDNSSQVLFHAVHGDTGWGDTMVIVGSDPALGAWNPWAGVPMGGEMWPNWTARTSLPAGAHVEWKIVKIRANGEVLWEPGPNRVLDLPTSGRAAVISGTYGDTSKTWTPADAR